MRIFSFIIVIFILLLGITFAVMNATPVTLHYYVGTKTFSLSLLLALCFGGGVLLGFLLMLWPLLKQKHVNRRLTKQLQSETKS